jgi:lysophospholipase L1-like esterase
MGPGVAPGSAGRPPRRRRRWVLRVGPTLLAVLLCLLAGVGTSPAAPNVARGGSGPAQRWVVAWGSPGAWGYGTATDVTARQTVQLSAGGSALRVRISNAFGTAPLSIGAATVALQAAGAAAVAGSVRPLTFAGQASTQVPVGAVVTSDPVAMSTTDGTRLAVSLFVKGSDLVTVHPCCQASPYSYFTPNGGGDLVDSVTGAGLSVASRWSRWVDAVDVSGPAPDAVVAFGDSITDGFNTALRWTDALRSRLAASAAASRPAIVNEGITANTVSTVHPSYALVGGGPAGVDRLDRDALDQPGVRYLIVLLGTNDIWFGAPASSVIQALEEVSQRAERAGVEPIAVTLLPRDGSERWTAADQQRLVAVNRWMETSTAFPVVLNWARTVADVYDGACVPGRLFPRYDSGDHLHPDAAGQIAMANALPTALIGAPSVPPLAGALPVEPTPGCDPGPVLWTHPGARPVATRTAAASPAPHPAPTQAAAPAAQIRSGGGVSVLAVGLGLAVLLAATVFGAAWLQRRSSTR